MALELVSPPASIFRVGRFPNPFRWRPPLFSLAEAEHPNDGGRWDAPHADFATLYTATQPVGAFVETLAYVRRSLEFERRLLAATAADEPDRAFDPVLSGGRIPSSYFERVLGRAVVDGELVFVDVDHPRTHAQLTENLGDLLAEHGLREFDRGVVMGQDRRITRSIAGNLHERLGEEVGGLRYESRVYRGLECWARSGSVSIRCSPNARWTPLPPRSPSSSRPRSSWV